MNWIKNLWEKATSSEESGREIKASRDVKSNDWVQPLMDETDLTRSHEHICPLCAEKRVCNDYECPGRPDELCETCVQSNPHQPDEWDVAETDIEHAKEMEQPQPIASMEAEGEVSCPYCEGADMEKEAVAPPEWERTVKHVKEHHKDKVDNPWALAWWMKDKGYTPGKRMPSHAAQEPAKIEKEAAYEKGDDVKETLKKDFERDVKALGDYVLAEMLAEYELQGQGLPEKFAEEKEKQLKSVESNRSAAEAKLLKLIGEHSQIDPVAALERFSKEEHKATDEKNLYKPGLDLPESQNWEKKVDYDPPTDKERIEGMAGVGKEEKKGEVAKEAALESEAVKLEVSDSGSFAVEIWPSEGETLDDARKMVADYAKSHEGERVDVKDYENHLAVFIWTDSRESALHKMQELFGQEKSKFHHLGDEVEPTASKEETLKKVAEIESPWKVIKDAEGKEVIARVEDSANTKESKEDNDTISR